MKIVTHADVPDELAQLWLQHLRDFDAAHPGCHFSVGMETDAAIPIREMIEMLRIDPALGVIEVFARRKL